MTKRVKRPRSKPKNVVTLKVHRIDDEKNPIERKSHGVASGMGICEFAASILKINEELPASQKLSDATLARMMIQEFPGRSSMKRLEDGKTTMGYWRTLYNLGSLTRGKVPAVKSVRYSLTGVVKPPRHGRSKKSNG